MKSLRISHLCRCLALALFFATIAAFTLSGAEGLRAADAPVTITENGGVSYTLDNGIVKAVIDKKTGNILSLVYKGIETMGTAVPGYHGGWEEEPSLAAQVGGLTDSVTIDPAKNGGARAEISIKGVTKDQVMLTPTAPGGGTYCDIEIRFTMERGASGLYTYAVFSHPSSHDAEGIGESRYGIALNKDEFNWISVDADRNLLECTPRDWGTGVVINAKEQRILNQGYYINSVEHKYSYTAVQYTVPAYGWSSTKDHIGIWLINPSIEYLSGGATKLELDCHLDANDNPDPVILDYWRGTHYGGGAQCSMAAGEDWNKVVGPIYIYLNSLDKPKPTTQAEMSTLMATVGNPTVPASWHDNGTQLWQDALAQAKKEKALWPYDWVSGVDYPHKNERGNVSGQIVLDDPLAPTPFTKFTKLTVGLAHPDYAGGGGFGGGGRAVDWVHDAKYYQFWNDGSADGKFTLTNVRPGNYTLHAFATGVLGEFAQANITVEAGKNIDLGKLVWKPVRYGTQVWDIGYPDRTGNKFFKGDGANYWLWGWSVRYPLLFPNDITYTVGKSDYHKDWFFEQVPHNTTTFWLNPAAKDPANQQFGWMNTLPTGGQNEWRSIGAGSKANTWTIKFNLDKTSPGYAALRVSLAGADGGGGLNVTVNGTDVGTIYPTSTNALRYNTDRGVWQEHTQTFDAALLKQGENQIQLTVPAGDLDSGVVYDYLRLELNNAYKVDGTPITPRPST